ncbi:MAG: hypothetical protein ACFCVA_11280 [Gammaproteobacteria bacterium]
MTSLPLGRFLLPGLVAVLIGWPPSVPGGIKCWTTGEGVRECGNIVPPEYAQRSHRELSQQGFVVRQTARAKTREELEQEHAEELKHMAEESERARTAKEQAKRDRMLLYTFTNEEDLVLARDGKLQAIDARVKHMESRINKLERSMLDLRSRVALAERRGDGIPSELQGEIVSIERQIADNREVIQRWHAEQEEVKASFEADLQRFRQLKGKEHNARSDRN